MIADITTSTSSTTTPTTTAADDDGRHDHAAPTTTTARPRPTIPAGVRVAGVRVGGLTPAEAVAAVQAAFATPLPVVVDRSKLVLDPRTYASAYIPTAVAKARIATPGTNVKLVVAVRGAPLRAWVDKVAAALRAAGRRREAHLPQRPARDHDRIAPAARSAAATSRAVIAAALAANSRLPVRLRTARVAPTVDRGVVQGCDRDRPLDEPALPLRPASSCTARSRSRPARRSTRRRAGTFHIVVKWKNPWWYPPTQDSWAKGLKPVPPGPDNPLGTRWMGISAPGVGIHGTDAPSSIGYSLSHGCIRMQVPDAEWLFDHVEIGTTVHIV